MGAFFNVFPKDGKVYLNVAVGDAAVEKGPFDWIEVRPTSREGRVKVELRTAGGWVTSGAREYWGAMRVVSSSQAGSLNLFNVVLMEQYLGSIGEVEYDWGQPGCRAYAPEAVKAQAVAARTYAVVSCRAAISSRQPVGPGLLGLLHGATVSNSVLGPCRPPATRRAWCSIVAVRRDVLLGPPGATHTGRRAAPYRSPSPIPSLQSPPTWPIRRARLSVDLSDIAEAPSRIGV